MTAPIVGASKPHYPYDALEPLELEPLELKLAAAELKALEEPYQPHPVFGHA